MHFSLFLLNTLQPFTEYLKKNFKYEVLLLSFKTSNCYFIVNGQCLLD